MEGSPRHRDPQYLVGRAALPHAFQVAGRHVKRGILMAGGFPMELPALSLSESLLKPTTMPLPQSTGDDAESCCAATRSTAWC